MRQVNEGIIKDYEQLESENEKLRNKQKILREEMKTEMNQEVNNQVKIWK